MRYRVRAESKGAFVGEGEVVLGRSPYSTLMLDHASVSRLHASVRLVDGALQISDLGSSNGTFVAGKRLTGPTAVAPGDDIKLGTLQIHIDEVHRWAAAETTRRQVDDDATHGDGGRG